MAPSIEHNTTPDLPLTAAEPFSPQSRDVLNQVQQPPTVKLPPTPAELAGDTSTPAEQPRIQTKLSLTPGDGVPAPDTHPSLQIEDAPTPSRQLPIVKLPPTPAEPAEGTSTPAEQLRIEVKLPPTSAEDVPTAGAHHGISVEDDSTADRQLPALPEHSPIEAEQPSVIPQQLPTPTEQGPISDALPVRAEHAAEPSGITTIPRNQVPQARPRAGSRSELKREIFLKLPTCSYLHIPDFLKPAPQDTLDRATLRMDNIPGLEPIERAKLKALVKLAINQDSLANEINTSTVDGLKLVLEQLELGIDRFLHRQTGGSRLSSAASSNASSQADSEFSDTASLPSTLPSLGGGPSAHQGASSRRRRRYLQRTLRENLLRRESRKCAISHYADEEMLIAAHILPFSVSPPDDPCWGMLRLFLGPNLEILRQRYTSEGINCLDNAWMLSTTLDKSFSNARCCLEPIPEPDTAPPADLGDGGAVSSPAEQASYSFRWLDEPVEPQRYSIGHRSKSDERIRTGDIITLRTANSVNYPLPNRYLLTIQAAVFKLTKEFRALADVFPDTHDSDDGESVSCLDKDDGCEGYWDEGYGSGGYWTRVQSWLDSWPEKEVEGFLPVGCGGVGGFRRGFEGSMVTSP